MGLFGLFGGNKSNPEDSIPQNDAERWTVGVYALWSEYCGGSYKYFGGYEKNRSNASMVRGVLNRDWVVSGKESLLDMVDYILKEENREAGEEEKRAFDYGCAGNMLARGYIGGYLTKEELMAESAKVAKAIRAHYNSWQEYAQQYITGVGMESGVADKQEKFREIYERLVAIPNGPYTVKWDTPLQEIVGAYEHNCDVKKGGRSHISLNCKSELKYDIATAIASVMKSSFGCLEKVDVNKTDTFMEIAKK